jgi:hypothetical protein
MLERVNMKDCYSIVTPMEEELQLNLNMEVVLKILVTTNVSWVV